AMVWSKENGQQVLVSGGKAVARSLAVRDLSRSHFDLPHNLGARSRVRAAERDLTDCRIFYIRNMAQPYIEISYISCIVSRGLNKRRRFREVGLGQISYHAAQAWIDGRYGDGRA